MKRKVVGAQNVSSMCLVCGRVNDFSLKARFYELDDGELLGIFTPLQEHQGYPGRLHGGMASTLLDETMGRAINIAEPDSWGVTVKLSVRYRQPVPIDGDVRAIARLIKNSSRLFECAGEIVLEDGSVAVEATGSYMKLPIEAIAHGDFSRQWFADERDVPSEIEL